MNRIVIEALGWTLVHFLWQGTLIAATLCVVDLVLARSRASLRYLSACVAFALMLLAPVATFFVLRGQATPPVSHVRSLMATPLLSQEELTPLAPQHRAAPARQLRPFSAPRTPFARLASARVSFSRLLPWVVELWVLGVVIVSLRLIGGWWLVRRLARAAGNVSLEAWEARLGDLAERMRVSRPVRLCRSALVEVPTVVGWMKPVILLPASTLTGLTPGQIEAILAHELAHIRRHDYLVNLLQSVVEMLLFYHPAVWWVSKRIRDERELCCDELAIRVSGDAVSYARALYELENLRGRSAELALAASGGSLARRIARLLGLPGRPWEATTRGLVGFVGASAVIALVVLSALEQSPALAQASTKIVRTTAQVAKVQVAKAVVAIEQRAVKVAAAVPALAKDAKHDLAAAAEAAQIDAAMADAAAQASQAPISTAVTTKSSTETSTDISIGIGESGTTVEVKAACNKDKDRDQDDDEDASSVTNRFSADEWLRMRQHGVSEKYIQNLHPYLPELTSDELITLADHGVSSLYVGNLKRAGLDDLSVDDLVRLASHGVQSKYVANVRNAGLDQVSVEDMVQLADHGVSSAYIRGLKGIDPDDLSVEQLIRLANSGVSTEWYSAMDWMGLSEFSVEQAIQLRNSGITPEYANKLKLVTHRRLTLEELRRLANNGVTSDYAARMYVLFGSDLEVEKLIQLRNNGVSSEYAEQMMVAAGPIDIGDLIQLRNQGVEPSYAYEMSTLGRLDTRDLIRLRQAGVTSDYVDALRRKGYERPSVNELIRMRQRGVPVASED